MLPKTAIEALHCLDRTALEGLQMHSRYLRDLINRHARTLPLRYIRRVKVVMRRVFIWLRDDSGVIIVRTIGVQDLEMSFRRLNNAFIHQLILSFGPENLPVLYYLRANASDLQCQIRVLRIYNRVGIDYALVDFLGVHLKPRVYERPMAVEFREDYAMLFAHDSLSGSVKHLVYEHSVTDTPHCIIRGLFGVNVVETCAITTNVDRWIGPWIGHFVQTFEMAEPGTDVVRSVTLFYNRCDEADPLRHIVTPLGQPRRTDARTPHSAVIKKWLRQAEHGHGGTTTESPVAELFVFENAKTPQKLKVFVWTVDEVRNDDWHAVHYAFLLQVLDM